MESWMRENGVGAVWVLADPEAVEFYRACDFEAEEPQPVYMTRELGAERLAVIQAARWRRRGLVGNFGSAIPSRTVVLTGPVPTDGPDTPPSQLRSSRPGIGSGTISGTTRLCEGTQPAHPRSAREYGAAR